MQVSSYSVFENVNILSLPHMMESYRAALDEDNMISKTFPIYSPVVKSFATKVITKANIFTAFDILEKVDSVQKDLIKFLSSNLNFTLENKNIDLSAPEDTFSTIKTTVKGHEAWAQKLINSLFQLSIDSDNEFISSLEIQIDSASDLKYLRLTADKIADDEMIEVLRNSFATFAKQHPLLALDLFKYSILMEGLYYQRNGLSLIFPDSWAATFSYALEERLKSILPIADIRTSVNLELLEDEFIFQFLRNNSNFISFPRGAAAVPVSKSEINKGFVKNTFEGFKDNYHFDIRINIPYSEQSPRFIKRYDSAVYALLPISDPAYSYYRKIIDNVNHHFYEFSPSQIDYSIDIEKILSIPDKIVSTDSIQGNTFTTADETEIVVKDQIIFAYDKSLPSPKIIKKYRVKTEGIEVKKYKSIAKRHQLEFLGQEILTKESKAKNLKDKVSSFVPDSLYTNFVVDSIAAQSKNIKGAKNTFALIPVDSTFEGPHFKLNIPKVDTEISEEELNVLLNNFEKSLNALPQANFYVDKNILENFEKNLLLHSKATVLLNQRLGISTSKKKISSTIEDNILRALKREELVSYTFNRTSFIIPVEDKPYTHFIKKEHLSNRASSSLTEGKIAYLGSDVYAFIDSVTEDGITLITFGNSLFDAMQKDVFTKEEFFNLKKINC
jgi:hypothetical protein